MPQFINKFGFILRWYDAITEYSVMLCQLSKKVQLPEH